MTPGKQVALVLGILGVILIATASSGASGIAGPALALGASLSLAIGSAALATSCHRPRAQSNVLRTEREARVGLSHSSFTGVT